MKNKINNKYYLGLVAILIFSISFVSAFAVSAPYMENKELYLTLGSEPTDLQFVLQNGGGATESVKIKTTIIAGEEIISITDEEQIYLVNPGEKVPVHLRITIPESAKAGDSYAVILSFSTVTVTNTGEFGFGTGQEQRFTAKIISEPQPEGKQSKVGNSMIYLGISIILLLIVTISILSKRKVKKK